ncbi:MULTISPECIES: hypothetical protein [unclassified Cupriavidus]|uniref:hypothetical protein n=1 Tax=unclassified Cupriavidus TaxID=2640874 RepID=UPI001C00551C|nr:MULTISPECIES: hypothetical protein [unclassified Cupriavidus]MCA3187900.1 hypothetical protein [Cupriavidus sp.]MCA3189447.1 hypothetical protein [Cupriavidus sp.]MCA3195527.1 hypothetical protein [Cupriavidus sp.]MCA3201082.1 hypothetical protein [Cupriavidus sp.]MCA3207904.1 hypothetical protein [Cupriavidus sp.]
MKPETVQLVADALQRAARKRALIPYQKFHALFPKDIRLPERYVALAEAVRLIDDARCIDYGVLLARDNGMPADEFFERFRHTRPDEYAAAIGVNMYRVSIKRQRALVESERARVFEHARRTTLNAA